MKQSYFFLGLITLSLIFTSCKSDPSSTESTDNTTENVSSIENLGDFIEFDLRPFELNASIMVPKDERTIIKHEMDTYVWNLKKGKQTFITIIDWGTKDGFDKYLEKLENHTENVDYIEKEKNFIVYKLTTGTSKVTYHTAAQYEIDGINYLFESSINGLSKDGVEHAIYSVKSVR